MRALLTVFAKEFRENRRDKRTLWSALLFGPLFGPLVFGFMVSRILEQNTTQSDEPVKITVVGAQRAPNLMRYLQAHGAVLARTVLDESAARALVRSGGTQTLLWVPAEYASRLAAGLPAPLLLFADSADSRARKATERARALIAAYGGGVAQLRLQVRGVDPLLSVPLAVNDVDVATPTGRAVLVLGMMTYFVLFAVLMGGLYLAIDATAGERERGSLEALLSLPVARGALVGGKVLATCAYMTLSLAICLAGFVTVFHFVPLERFGMSANLNAVTALAFFGICLPFVPLGASLMTLVASFARSYREAQTYLTSVLLVPTLPIAFASIYALRTGHRLMLIPSLSQHLLMTSVLKGDPVSAQDVAVSTAASLLLAALLLATTARLWRRESLLG